MPSQHPSHRRLIDTQSRMSRSDHAAASPTTGHSVLNHQPSTPLWSVVGKVALPLALRCASHCGLPTGAKKLDGAGVLVAALFALRSRSRLACDEPAIGDDIDRPGSTYASWHSSPAVAVGSWLSTEVISEVLQDGWDEFLRQPIALCGLDVFGEVPSSPGGERRRRLFVFDLRDYREGCGEGPRECHCDVQ
jgi:hypothetical protein